MTLLTKVLGGCCACLFYFATLSLSAQEAVSDTITGKVHQIDKVTVTARKLPNKITSAVPIQTLSQQDISQLGIQNMADAVRRFAGANVKDYGGIGGLKTVSIRNMGAAHTAVSYDGVVVSNCQAGQIDIGRFPLDNVSVLSLNIGQPEDLLQSARMYASAGVLSIETEKPHFDDGRSSAFRVQMRGGSFGYVSPSFRWWQKLGNRTRLSLDTNYMRADGNYPFTLVNGKYVTEEKRNNSAIYSYQAEPTLFHTFKDSSNLELKAYYFYSKRGLPGAVTLYNPISDETLWDENSFVQVRYKSNSRRDGLCRYKLSIIMGGISMKMRVMNMQMVCIVPFIGKTSIICRQPHYTVHGMLYLYLWHKTEPLISCAVICLTALSLQDILH